MTISRRSYSRTKSLIPFAFSAFFLLFTACTGERAELGTADNPIKFYFTPSVDATTISSQARVIEEYLEESTPYKFEVSVPQSYVAVVEAFGTKRADIAVLNTFGYILSNERYGAEARLTAIRFGSDTYRGQIIAKADGPIKSLEDIDGKKVAYVDPASTSGYLLPAQVFAENNIQPSETVFAKKHDNVVTMIYQGQVEAGATFYTPPENGEIQDARRLVLTQYPDVEKQIKIVELTNPIPNDPVVFRKGMPEEMKTKIVESLMAFVKTEVGKKAFEDLYGITGLIASSDRTYDGVRKLLDTLGKKPDELVK